jgi:hypothetical protein
MARLSVTVLSAALIVLLTINASAADDVTPQHFKPPGGKHRCRTGTAERPVHKLTLDDGRTFCLQLPRLLRNPENVNTALMNASKLHMYSFLICYSTL